MIQDVRGINEEKIDYLILDIYDYADRINQILNNIDELILKSNDYYNCESNVIFVNHYKELSFNSQILKQNILTTASDLVKAKHHYNNINDELKKVALQGINNINN